MNSSQTVDEPVEDQTALEEQTPAPPAAILREVSEPGAIVDGGERFPVADAAADGAVRLWWVGAHGGAGETTLERLLPGSRAANHAWPRAAADTSKPNVVVVARTSASGLGAAQTVVTEWAGGEIPVKLLGLVLVADAPGKLPKPLRDFSAVVAGGAPRVWRLPWSDAWRLGEPADPDHAPKEVRRCLEDLDQLVPPSTTHSRS